MNEELAMKCADLVWRRLLVWDAYRYNINTATPELYSKIFSFGGRTHIDNTSCFI